MSHIYTVELLIPDDPESLGYFREALAECGMEFMEGQREHAWFGEFVGDSRPPEALNPEDYGKCEHAARVKNAKPGCYEIGLVRDRDVPTSFRMAFDYWQGGFGLCDAIGGKDAVKLRNIYCDKVANAQMQHLARQGYRISQTEEDGKIRYRATR